MQAAGLAADEIQILKTHNKRYEDETTEATKSSTLLQERVDHLMEEVNTAESEWANIKVVRHGYIIKSGNTARLAAKARFGLFLRHCKARTRKRSHCVATLR